jgi:LGFP repeat
VNTQLGIRWLAIIIMIALSIMASNVVMPSSKALASSPTSEDCLTIWQKYQDPDLHEILGAPTEPETDAPDKVGRFQYFEHGSIYWSPQTCAHAVYGAIWAKWADKGWEQGILGYPVTDEISTPDHIGRYNHFQGGSIYWTPKTGAHEVPGAIRDKWADLGWETGLGYPKGNDGERYEFTRGVIYWIDQPNVKAPKTWYDDGILFNGDLVTIDAGGCVQTGGWGDTWKRYVNPHGRGSDRLYHGLVYLP